jgi:hypothetical protein
VCTACTGAGCTGCTGCGACFSPLLLFFNCSLALRLADEERGLEAGCGGGGLYEEECGRESAWEGI